MARCDRINGTTSIPDIFLWELPPTPRLVKQLQDGYLFSCPIDLDEWMNFPCLNGRTVHQHERVISLQVNQLQQTIAKVVRSKVEPIHCPLGCQTKHSEVGEHHEENR